MKVKALVSQIAIEAGNNMETRLHIDKASRLATGGKFPLRLLADGTVLEKSTGKIKGFITPQMGLDYYFKAPVQIKHKYLRENFM